MSLNMTDEKFQGQSQELIHEKLWSEVTALASEGDFDSLLQRVLVIACQLTQAQRGSFYLLDCTHRFLDLAAQCQRGVQHYQPSTFIRKRVPLYIDHRQNHKHVFSYSVLCFQKVVITDVRSQGGFDCSDLIEEHKRSGFIGQTLFVWPLQNAKGINVGILVLENAINPATGEPTQFKENYGHTIEAFFSLLALMVNNARLLRENKQLVQVLQKTNDELSVTSKEASLQSKAPALSNKGVAHHRQMVGQGPAFQQVLTLIQKVAPTQTSVFINGETGVGKELVAHEVHRLSKNPKAPFVAINCAALPEHLLESELFGFKKGAFTGADADRKGLFQQADGGTLFLDEIGDLPLPLQAKLLRVLQEGEIRPLGCSDAVKVKVRLITATHQNLNQLSDQNLFRKDLYYRLNIFPILVPPLRDRQEDIAPLIEHFVEHYCLTHEKKIAGISPSALQSLLRYDYPGNIRELSNLIERAVLLSEEHQLIPLQALPQEIVSSTIAPLSYFQEEAFQEEGLKSALKQYEASLIQQALKVTDGNQTQAALRLKISRRALIDKVKRYNLAHDIVELES